MQPPRAALENLVEYIERSEVRPLVAKTYSLVEIVRAQEDFMAKQCLGKPGLVPPTDIESTGHPSRNTLVAVETVSRDEHAIA